MFSLLLATYCILIGVISLVYFEYQTKKDAGEDNIFRKILSSTEIKVFKVIYYMLIVFVALPPMLFSYYLALKDGNPFAYFVSGIFILATIMMVVENIKKSSIITNLKASS
jgi:hypothetical protein